MNIFERLEEISRAQNLFFMAQPGNARDAYEVDVLIRKSDAQKWLALLATDSCSLKYDGGYLIQISNPLKMTPTEYHEWCEAMRPFLKDDPAELEAKLNMPEFVLKD